MEPISITILAVVSLCIIPALIALCADSKDSNEPELRSLKKNGSKGDSKKVTKSSDSTKHKSKPNDTKEAVIVITNGNAAGAPVDVSARSSGHTYDDPEAHHPQDINAVLTNGGSTNPKASVVNETSPSSSQRSSRASGGQPRVVSQDRALPDIPQGQPARLSVNSERSPSTKRALPELPSAAAPATSAAVTAAEDEAASHYDQLERDLPPHQIKSKASSESSSVKVKMRFAIDEEGSASSELIEPDEVTRSSVFVSTDPHEVYSCVTDDGAETTAKPDERSSLKPLELTKSKARSQYTKIKKEGASSELRSPGSESVTGIGGAAEPVYEEAPPVPVKMYSADEELQPGEANGAAAVDGAVAACSVALVIDNNAQDSGSGYYAVTDDGNPPDVVVSSPHANIPASYDILTARESIATVRARQTEFEEEDYYESMDDKAPDGQVAAASNLDDGSGAMELYEEIDKPPAVPTTTAPAITDSTKRPPVKQKIAPKEELYAEIDSPQPNPSSLSPAAAMTTRVSDPGYEKVDFTGSKGEQISSAGYARGAAAAATANNPINDDEEDYAECDPVPSDGMARVPPAVINDQLSRQASDVSDYATVSYGNDDGQAAVTQPDAQQQSPPMNNDERPFQRYPRREHVYQEIDEVGREDMPPDKKI